MSYGEFEDYYEGLSIGIVDDEDFVSVYVLLGDLVLNEYVTSTKHGEMDVKYQTPECRSLRFSLFCLLVVLLKKLGLEGEAFRRTDGRAYV